MDSFEDDNEVFVLLSLGANLGDRKKKLEKAVSLINENMISSSLRSSSYYETEPVGFIEQPWYLNIAISGFTSLQINVFFQFCKSIEYLLDRKARERWHEREIDIDILLFGSQIIETEKLIIPHKRMHKRRFVLTPAAEIAGSLIHPKLEVSIERLLLDCNDNSNVRKILNSEY